MVDEAEVRQDLAPLYRDAYDQLQNTIYKDRRHAAEEAGDDGALRVMRSSDWLAENFEQVPLWLLFFSRNDPSGASIYPAVWNAMLAARGEGVGTCLTTILGVFKSQDVFELLGIPGDKGWRFSAAVSCGYPLGRWGLARRSAVEEVAYSNAWGQDLDFEVAGPLWAD